MQAVCHVRLQPCNQPCSKSPTRCCSQHCSKTSTQYCPRLTCPATSKARCLSNTVAGYTRLLLVAIQVWSRCDRWLLLGMSSRFWLRERDQDILQRLFNDTAVTQDASLRDQTLECLSSCYKHTHPTTLLSPTIRFSLNSTCGTISLTRT